MKESYDDPIKDITRKILKKEIERHLGFPRTNFKVACFPGKEALELKIYDSLGIPRQNIFGLEKDGAVYNHLKRQNLGINLRNLTDTEFFEQTNEKFEVISLDYTGYLNKQKARSFELIGKKRLMADKAILFTNFQARRENQESFEGYGQALKDTYKSSAMTMIFGSKEEQFDLFDLNEAEKIKLGNLVQAHLESSADEFRRAMNMFAKEKNVSNLSKEQIRDIGVPVEIVRLIGLSSQYFEKSKLFLRFLDFIPPDNIYKFIEKITSSTENYKSVLLEMLDIKNNLEKKEYSVPLEEKVKFLSEVGDTQAVNALFNLFTKHVFEWESPIAFLAKVYDLDSHILEKARLFKYQSEAGSPMETNIFNYISARKKIPQLKEYYDRFFEIPTSWWFHNLAEKVYISLSDKIKKEKPNIQGSKLIMKSAESIEGYYDELKKVLSEGIAPFSQLIRSIGEESHNLMHGKIKREYLGSSFKEKYESEQVARWHIEGKPDDAIHKACRISTHELAAVKAWVTMGKYDHIKKGIEDAKKAKVQEMQPDLQEKLEDKTLPIYVDILSGMPDAEIKRKYNLGTMPLAGYKAAIGRGDREELIKKAFENAWNLSKKAVINEIVYPISKEKGIGYISKGDDLPKEIKNLYKEQLNVEKIRGLDEKGLYVIFCENGDMDNSIKTIEDICLSYSNPAILVIGNNNPIKDRLQDSVNTQKGLGIVSRIFYHAPNNLAQSLNEILEDSYLVR